MKNTPEEAEALLRLLKPSRDGKEHAASDQNAVFAAFRCLRRIALERPIYMCAHELHRAGAFGLAFLEHAVFELSFAPFQLLIFAGVAAGQDQDMRIRTLTEVPPSGRSVVNHIKLAPLDVDVLAECLRRDYQVDRDIAYQLAEISGGSPMIATHLAQIGLSSGDSLGFLLNLSQTGSSHNASYLTPVLTDLLATIVESRLITHQNREARWEMVEATAVLGNVVEYQLLCQMHDSSMSRDDIDECIMTLLDFGFLSSEGQSDQERLIFTPSILRDLFIERLSNERRIHLHRLAVDAYHRLQGDDLDAILGEVGDHYAGAQQWDEAVEYWKMAFEFETRHGNALRGVPYAQKVIEYCGLGESEIWSIALRVGKVFLDTGAMDQARSLLESMLVSPDADEVMVVGEVLADVYENQGDARAWKALVEQLDAEMDGASEHGLRAYLRTRAMCEQLWPITKGIG